MSPLPPQHAFNVWPTTVASTGCPQELQGVHLAFIGAIRLVCCQQTESTGAQWRLRWRGHTQPLPAWQGTCILSQRSGDNITQCVVLLGGHSFCTEATCWLLFWFAVAMIPGKGDEGGVVARVIMTCAPCVLNKALHSFCRAQDIQITATQHCLSLSMVSVCQSVHSIVCFIRVPCHSLCGVLGACITDHRPGGKHACMHACMHRDSLHALLACACSRPNLPQV